MQRNFVCVEEETWSDISSGNMCFHSSDLVTRLNVALPFYMYKLVTISCFMMVLAVFIIINVKDIVTLVSIIDHCINEICFHQQIVGRRRKIKMTQATIC